MSVQDIAKLGKLLAQFLAGFAGCFARPGGRVLLAVYVRGLLSSVQRKNAEAIALEQNVAPRTLQRFLESIVWDERQLRDRWRATDCGRTRQSRCHRLHRRDGNGQERPPHRRRQTAVQRQSRQDRKLRQPRRAGLLGSWVRLFVGRSVVPSHRVDRGSGASKKTTSPTTSPSKRSRKSPWS